MNESEFELSVRQAAPELAGHPALEGVLGVRTLVSGPFTQRNLLIRVQVFVSGLAGASFTGVRKDRGPWRLLCLRVGSAVLRTIPFLSASVVCVPIRRPDALLWLGVEREVQRHLRPLADVAFYLDAAAVRLGYGSGDGKSQPGTSLLAPSGFIVAEEALEDVRQVLFGNAGAAVFDPNEQLAGLGLCGEGHALPGWAVLGGVIH
jgi:hypothetical protein